MKTRIVVVFVLLCIFGGFTEAQLQAVTTPSTNNLTRTGCGSTKLCVSSVDGCNPSGNSSCFFTSTQFSNGVLTVELSGSTTGYVALGLTPASNQTQQLMGLNTNVLVCGNNNTNNNLFFQTALLQNNTLTVANLNASTSALQGLFLLNTTVQCTFNLSITNLNQTFPNFTSVQLLFNVTILNGTTNGTQLGTQSTVFTSNGSLDLASLPRSNIPTTASPPTTTAAPSSLNIVRTGCGSTKLCLSNTSTCDPTQNSSCFFASVRLVSQNFSFELSGTTSGYVALGLVKPPSTQAVVFVCANNASGNSSNFFFTTATKNGTSLNVTSVNTVYSTQGIVAQNQTVIQCLFNTSTSFTVSTRADDTTYQAIIMSGTTNGTQLTSQSTVFTSNGPLDLANPMSNIPTAASPTTTTAAPSSLNIDRTGCGSTKLCLSNTSTCDPTQNSSCFFASVRLVNQNFSFELSGTTSGYVALGLVKPPSTQAVVFVCANNASGNSSNFFFTTATKNGTSLNVTSVNTVYSTQGIVAQNQTVIQCLFNTSTSFTVSTRADNTTYQAIIMSGTTNGTNLGDPTVRADTVVAVDLSNVTALNTPNAPNSANTISSFCTRVLALLLSALTLRLI